MGKKNKHNAVKTSVDGKKFDSKGEADRYFILFEKQEKGEINNLIRQIPFYLHAGNGVFIGEYIADFQYELPSGEVIIEDFKGRELRDFVWKKKHMFAEYGITIKVSKKAKDDILPPLPIKLKKPPKRKNIMMI